VSPLVPKEDIVLFYTVYSVAKKKEMPSEKVNSLLQLQRINGVDVQYKNLSWDTINAIQESISFVISKDLVSEINSSPNF